MGQDRELSSEQKRFALSTIQKYKEIWEKVEQENLSKDKIRKLRLLDQDPVIEADMLTQLNEEHDKEIEERLAEREDLADEELKDLEVKSMRYNMQAKLFLPEGKWREGLESIVEFKVLKMPRIM